METCLHMSTIECQQSLKHGFILLVEYSRVIGKPGTQFYSFMVIFSLYQDYMASVV